MLADGLGQRADVVRTGAAADAEVADAEGERLAPERRDRSAARRDLSPRRWRAGIADRSSGAILRGAS
jgi:hypothetical protein